MMKKSTFGAVLAFFFAAAGALTAAALYLYHREKELDEYERLLFSDDGDDYDDDEMQGGTAVLDPELYAMLIDLRKRVAKKQGLAPYVIFFDASLEQMATMYPITLQELQNIQGVGAGKAKRYGQAFCDLIRKHCEENGIVRPEDFRVKTVAKKSLAEIAMTYGYVYVAQIAMGANMNQTLKAIAEAEAYHGPSLIIGYAPCEMHSIKGGMANCQAEMKKAVECGYWNLFRFNPALKAEGKNPFTLDSKAPAGGYQEFLMNEARYSSLTRSFPDRAKELFALNEETAKARYEKLIRMQKMYEV